jgi:hypothetical protein
MGYQLMKIIETNCETGEVIERDMTAEEQAAYETIIAEGLAAEAAEAAQKAVKASANAKLAALGLTSEEVAAILGVTTVEEPPVE